MLILLTALNTADAKKTLSVSKTQEIDAPAEIVWGYVSNFETWKDWTVWNPEMDPECEWTYSGEAGQVGHGTEWNGPEMGEGKMVSTAVEDGTSWSYDLYFDGKDKAYPGGLTLAEADGVTTVTWDWSMEMGGLGAALMGKKITGMVGDDFSGGLANLAEIAAADADAAELAAAEAAVNDAGAAAAAASAALGEADAAATAAGEAKTAAEEALGKARRKSDKAAAQTALDEATAAATAADEALAAAKTAAEGAATALTEAEAALAGLKGEGEEAPAEEAAEEAPAEEAPAEESAEEAPAAAPE